MTIKTKNKDINGLYLLLVFVLTMVNYAIFFNHSNIGAIIGGGLSGLILGLPIIGIIYLVKKIRKKPYIKPKLDLIKIWIFITILGTVGHLLMLSNIHR